MFRKRGGTFTTEEEIEKGVGEERGDFGHMPGFKKFKKGELKGVIGAKISEKEMGNYVSAQPNGYRQHFRYPRDYYK